MTEETVLKYQFGRILSEAEQDQIIEAIELEMSLTSDKGSASYDWKDI